MTFDSIYLNYYVLPYFECYVLHRHDYSYVFRLNFRSVGGFFLITDLEQNKVHFTV